MLREEQIDLRRQRARATKFAIENLGKNRVFSDFRVTNPDSGGRYEVTVRGFETGDNTCTCPDYKANTLGTCKHIEAVLDDLRDELPPHLQKKKAAVQRPEVYLHYGEQLRLGLHLPPRHSDKLARLAQAYFDDKFLWSGRGKFPDLIRDIEAVPEEVTVLSDALDFVDREVERADLLAREAEWLARLDAGTLDLNLLPVPLYDYQLRGALFLACRGRSILGDDMGLGKTVQTLAAVELLAQERGIRRVLVVAPASVKYQWETEIRRFTRRPVQVIDGLPDVRKEQYEQPTFYRLVNYEQVVRDREALNGWKPDVVVLDEAQRIKNWEAKTTREVKKLHSRYAFVLTGTPLENKLEELYSIVQFVDERRFGPAFAFLHEHRVVDADGNLTGYRNLDAIRDKLAPIFLRRTRAEVLTQLPERTDNTVFVELADEQRGPYEEQRAALARLLAKNYLTDLDRKRILACVVNLRTICDSTFLHDRATHISPKLDEFAELLPELVGGADAHKVVVFSQWETMIFEAARVLDRLGVGYAVLHGGLSGKDRKAALEKFLTDPACAAFLSTDAGGTGLNLQAADTVVNLELPWNPAVLEQRIARVHRMGQERPVRVVNFVTRGTIEERVLRTLEAKQSLFDGLFEGDADELAFAAGPGFLGALRKLTGEETGDGRQETAEPEPATPAPSPASPVSRPPTPDLWVAAAQLLEALAAAGPVPDAVRERVRAAAALVAERARG
ncbi:DEAD/DEAH box helicase [Urbifossiella limnaea]|uniref:RNA polymerase-associated protein RapA n=1 Tax=Urbifossiella limnaea TaxID=2528023 RepID=A0A517XLB3_9BACT|nr:DEAD/DEAH box helicase [Urbifossiella limnaea]QDU18301.1 RNA polymerase-associated protein RapA [Urbifossiella limnaea]